MICTHKEEEKKVQKKRERKIARERARAIPRPNDSGRLRGNNAAGSEPGNTELQATNPYKLHCEELTSCFLHVVYDFLQDLRALRGL